MLVYSNDPGLKAIDFTALKSVGMQNVVLTEPRFALSKALSNELIFTKDFKVNLTTQDMLAVKFDMTGGVEAIEPVKSGVYPQEELWVSLESQGTAALEPEETFKIGNQVIDTLLSNGSTDTARMGLLAKIYTRLDPVRQNLGSGSEKEVHIDPSFLDYDLAKIDVSRPSGASLSSRQSGMPTCRVCLLTEKENNAFVQGVCSCSNRMPIHYDCLTNWLSTKIKINLSGLIFYNLTQAVCELCKKRYPPVVVHQGRRVPLFKIGLPANEKSMVTMVHEANKRDYRFVIVSSYNHSTDTKISIGSNDNVSLKFYDPTISEKHAFFHISKGTVTVTNNDKRYGVLRRLRRRVLLSALHGKTIVINRFAIVIHLFKGLKCCGYLKTACGREKLNPAVNDPKFWVLDPPPTPVETATVKSLPRATNLPSIANLKDVENTDTTAGNTPTSTQHDLFNAHSKPSTVQLALQKSTPETSLPDNPNIQPVKRVASNTEEIDIQVFEPNLDDVEEEEEEESNRAIYNFQSFHKRDIQELYNQNVTLPLHNELPGAHTHSGSVTASPPRQPVTLLRLQAVKDSHGSEGGQMYGSEQEEYHFG